MPSPRAQTGRVFSAAALFLVAALRAHGESAATVGAFPSGGGVSDEISGDEVDIPVGAVSRTPSVPTTAIDVERFAGEQTSVAELLAASPGTTVRALGGPLQTATVSLRGASADESLILLDGIPLHGPGGGAFDLSAIPVALISRIVVHRGVLGAQLGAGALGGAIEIVPRAAQAETQVGVRGSFGSFQTAQLAGELSCGASCGALQGVTGAIQLDRTGGGFGYLRSFTPDVAGAPLVQETRQNDDATRLGILVRDETEIAAGTTLDVLALGSLGDRGLPGPIGAFTLRSRSEDQSGIVGARVRRAEGSAVLSARAWAQIDRVVLNGSGDGFSSCASGNDRSCAEQETHSLSARGEVEASFPIGGLQWATATLSGGSDWFAGQGAGVHRRGVGSLALHDEFTLLGGALSLAPAVRLDAIGADLAASPALAISMRPFAGAQTRAVQQGASGQSMPLPASMQSAQPALSTAPLANADTSRGLLELLAPLEFRASAGLSFRAPSFAELYLQQGGTSPNPSLRPERAGSIDVGAAYHTARVTVAGTLFWSRFRDLILYELYPPAREKPFNIGQARVLGAELEALVVLPLGFTAELSWSYLQAIDERPAATETGQKLPYRPPHRLFARAARRGDRLEGFAEAVFSSSMPRNQFGTTSLPSQFTLSCGLGARVVGPLWVDLELKNALDDQTQQDLFQYPLPGLSLSAIARARF